jgi:hypothetical protein
VTIGTVDQLLLRVVSEGAGGLHEAGLDADHAGKSCAGATGALTPYWTNIA